jgi:ATP-dependent exoDNAse (exonuclease V) beta subunit
MAALDTGRSFIVEASAGSGKTELLIQRYLKLLTKVESPEQVLAITFTRKAAAEMQDRTLQELRDAELAPTISATSPHKQFTRKLASDALQASRDLGWDLTRQSQRMNVRTIDSLCSEITSRLPILTRMGPTSRPVTDATELYYEAASSVLKQFGGKDENLNGAIQTLLLHLDNRFEMATQLLAGLLSTRDQWGHIFPILKEADGTDIYSILHGKFERSLEKVHEDVIQELKNNLSRDKANEVFSLLQYAANALHRANRNNPYNSCLSWTQLPEYDAQHARDWGLIAKFLTTGNGDFRKKVDVTIGFDAKSTRKSEMKDVLASFSGNKGLLSVLQKLLSLPPMYYTGQQRKVLHASFLLLRHALAQLKITFARTATCDFIELMLSAQQALSEDANNIALSLGTSIQHLLVDEMQDTSVTQFQLLRLLVQSWDGHSQTVFLVGDPKQSIYRFRQAEVALFAYAREFGLGGVTLLPLYLTNNFRSQQSLVTTTNQYFQQVFPQSDDVDHVPFSPSISANVEVPVERAHWHPYIYTRHKRKNRDSVEHAPNETAPEVIEAQNLCDVVERQRKADQTSGTATQIAVLVSNKRHAWPILKEMQRRKIHYRAIEMDTLADRQSLLDLLAITRCLLHAADRIAWLAVLRAPWCGLTLADLHILCGEDDQQYRQWTVPELLRAHIHKLSIDGRQRAERVWRTLEKAPSLLRQERLATVVERTWHSLGGPACISGDDMPATDQFFTMLDALEDEGGPITTRRLEGRMEKLYAPATVSGEEAVEVLTIHKAKGLEWDVVLLPGLQKWPKQDGHKLLVWAEELHIVPPNTLETQLYLAPIKHASEESDPISKWIGQRITGRENAERKRLFYVACTRARKELHLFASVAKNEKGEILAPHSKSLLHVAWPFAEEIFLRQVEMKKTQPAHSDTVLSMPRTTMETGAGIIESIAAEAAGPAPGKRTQLSNFRRLPSGWSPAPLPPDVLLPPPPEEWVGTKTEDQAQAFQRPQGSWKARLFGTVVHALLPPLAQILRAYSSQVETDGAILGLRQPAMLHLVQEGHTQKDAQTTAGRILHILMEVSRDPVAQWMLAAHPNVDDLLPDFEVPLTALVQGAVRSVRMDRLFLAGPGPLAEGDDQPWIVDFKTATHGEGNREQFLEEQRMEYTGQMQLYAQVLRAVHPQRKNICLGLYYPLLQQFIWWVDGT